MANASLEFWHKQANGSGDQDTLTVYYKTSSAGIWTQLAIRRNPSLGDYGNPRLLPDSACIDAGNNAAVPADTADLVDIGAYEYLCGDTTGDGPHDRERQQQLPVARDDNRYGNGYPR